MRSIRNVLFALVLLSITLFFVIGSLSYDPVARQIPLLVGVPVAILLTLEILVQFSPATFAVLNWIDRRQVIDIDPSVTAQVEASGAPAKQGRHLEFHAWTAGFLVTIYLVGFLTAIPLFLVALLHLRLKEKLWISLTAASAMWAVAYVGFVRLMEVPLYPGVL